MATLSYVVDQVRRRLEPDYLASVTFLTADAGAGDLSLTVDDVSKASNGGVVEVGSELMRVRQVDADTSTLQLYPFGRGYNSTTVADHANGDMVVLNPTYPFGNIVDYMNGVIGELYGMGLFAVATFESTYVSNVPFVLPAEVVTPVAVFTLNQQTNEYNQTYNWRFVPDGNSQLWLANAGDGQTVRVVYTKAPTMLDPDQPDQDFYLLTGYPERMADIVALGVAYKMSALRAAARVNKMAASASADAQAKPISEGRLLSQVLYAEFQQRVQGELQMLGREHPISLHKTF
jgi:hypothetical protein